MDEIVRKPFGGAHLGWQAIMEILSIAIAKHISELQEIPIETLPAIRADKFIPMTRYVKIIGCDIKQLNK